MEQIVFASMSYSNVLDPHVSLFVNSIRKYAGTFSTNPIWLFVPTDEEEIPEDVRENYSSMNVTLFPVITHEEDSKFPFVNTAYAASKAEALAKNKTKLLAWIGINSIIINEPKHFILDEQKNLGYRPVHHTLIGSVFDEPIDNFWKVIYETCNVSEDQIFPMKTHVDGKIIRPYFNSGFQVVRPSRGLFQLWWDKFRELYKDPIFSDYYNKSDLYVTFIHQAVLSGVILSNLRKEELIELPFDYNYPLHLYPGSLEEYQPENLNQMITMRYYMEKLIDSKWMETVPLHDPIKSWVEEQLS